MWKNLEIQQNRRLAIFQEKGSVPNGANLRRIWDFGVGFWMGGFFWEHGPWRGWECGDPLE
jgi:hypothetical protein